jgi:NTP pyrophosphatase (non-canonical NTP hydrolase)
VSRPAGVDQLLGEVRAELERAVAKFPTWPTDPLHAAGVVGEEAGELYKAVLQRVYEPHKASIEDVRAEAIQTAAMAVRFLLSVDRYEFQRCAQHEQGRAE